MSLYIYAQMEAHTIMSCEFQKSCQMWCVHDRSTPKYPSSNGHFMKFMKQVIAKISSAGNICNNEGITVELRNTQCPVSLYPLFTHWFQFSVVPLRLSGMTCQRNERYSARPCSWTLEYSRHVPVAHSLCLSKTINQSNGTLQVLS